MKRKHTASNVIPTAPNVIFPAPNVIPVAPNVIPVAPNVIPTAPNVCHNKINKNQCDICNKVFSRKTVMLKHIDKCKGNISNLQCEYCNKNFTNRCNKSRHLRLCTIKKEMDSQALTLHTNEEHKINSIIEAANITNNNNNIQNAEVINNNVNKNCNNTNSNNVTNIIVFDPKNMELLNDHISKGELKKMVSNFDFSKVLTDYSKALLSRKENQCVRKTNLNSASSAIHVGEDKWEYQCDREVLPKLLSNIATNFGNIQDVYKIKIMEELDTFIIDVQSEAIDCHEDAAEEARLKALFKRTSNNVKHLLFNLTKQALIQKRKQHKQNENTEQVSLPE